MADYANLLGYSRLLAHRESGRFQGISGYFKGISRVEDVIFPSRVLVNDQLGGVDSISMPHLPYDKRLRLCRRLEEHEDKSKNQVLSTPPDCHRTRPFNMKEIWVGEEGKRGKLRCAWRYETRNFYV